MCLGKANNKDIILGKANKRVTKNYKGETSVRIGWLIG